MTLTNINMILQSILQIQYDTAKTLLIILCILHFVYLLIFQPPIAGKMDVERLSKVGKSL